MAIAQEGARPLLQPSSDLLFLSLALTVWAKLGALFMLDASERVPGDLPAIVAPDFAVFFGLSVLFGAMESIRSWIRVVTFVLSTVVAVIAGINALYIVVTGGQLSVGAIALGFERTSVAWQIASWDGSVPAFIGSAFAVVLIPVCFRLGLRRFRPERLDGARSGYTRVAATLAGIAALVWWFTTSVLGLPSTMATQELAANSIVRVGSSWLTEAFNPPAELGWSASDVDQSWSLVDPAGLETLRSGRQPNVLVLALESTRLDHVDLPGAGWESPAETPNLRALAERGAWVHGVRAVVPHTTKALFSMECGRIPPMQPEPAELTLQVQPVCLPRTLAAAGYETAFFQSAIGFFENRASLVDRFGYQSFHAWEQIQGEPLGYLASDDRSLGPAFAAWLDAREVDGPFYATLLTSATHHPYALPDDVESPPGVERRGVDGTRARYARLVELEDVLLGVLVAALEERGLLEETLIVAVGDHGEGLPGDRIRQHDNNYLDEGLLVPLVAAGPGVPLGRFVRDVSLAGLAPTILAFLGAPSALPMGDLRFGADVFSADAVARPSIFGCYHYDYCLGWIEGGRKVVERPPFDERFYVDLRADPKERRALPFESGMVAKMRQLRAMAASTLVLDEASFPPDRTLFGEWHCAERDFCRHPNSPEDTFHEPPGHF